ncbi:MAG: phage tail protein [Acidimicrobiales bacterium]|jgi:microcystin-dependent protein
MPTTPYLGQIMMVSFNFPPKGWALCNGQLLAINQNQALFSILGTTYGGDGRVNFGLPNLQGRVPIHVGAGFVLGESGGEDSHTLILPEIPTHTHGVTASSLGADSTSPIGAFLAGSGNTNYGAPGTASGALAPQAVAVDGGGQPHENRSPFTVINFVIALVGIFPSRS